jgi:hypothetical protein
LRRGVEERILSEGEQYKCSVTSVDVGTRVGFMSDYGTVTGVVVITLGGLYGIYRRIRGTFGER